MSYKSCDTASKETVEHGEESWSLGWEASGETLIEEGLESRLNSEFLMFTFRDVPPKMCKSVRNPRKGRGTHFSKYGGKLGCSLAVATAGIHPGARGSARPPVSILTSFLMANAEEAPKTLLHRKP